MLGHRRRRCPNISLALGQCIVFFWVGLKRVRGSMLEIDKEENEHKCFPVVAQWWANPNRRWPTTGPALGHEYWFRHRHVDKHEASIRLTNRITMVGPRREILISRNIYVYFSDSFLYQIRDEELEWRNNSTSGEINAAELFASVFHSFGAGIVNAISSSKWRKIITIFLKIGTFQIEIIIIKQLLPQAIFIMSVL